MCNFTILNKLKDVDYIKFFLNNCCGPEKGRCDLKRSKRNATWT